MFSGGKSGDIWFTEILFHEIEEKRMKKGKIKLWSFLPSLDGIAISNYYTGNSYSYLNWRNNYSMINN